jgi:outer membrane protein OmpA-like peptidoglycan-associated protein
MENRASKFKGVILTIVIAGGVALLPRGEFALAGDQPTEGQIFEALKPMKTRGFGGGAGSPADPKAAEDRRFIQGLRTRSARGLSPEERERVTEIAKERPNIDLEVTFDYDSAIIGPRAASVLVALGRALSKEELKGVVFLVNGHTDAKGGAEYNQDLSERRAEAVRRFLAEKFGLASENLVPIGYGKTQLKNAADPYAGENRRVQIVNTEVK